MVKGCVRNFFANGAIAQLVEQRTENPCVTGSIPVGTTKGEDAYASSLFCVCLLCLFIYIFFLSYHRLDGSISPLL